MIVMIKAWEVRCDSQLAESCVGSVRGGSRDSAKELARQCGWQRQKAPDGKLRDVCPECHGAMFPGGAS